MQFEVMTITPELAADWLLLNIGNRPPRPKKIAQYARDMASGKWLLTGEAIKFGSDGRLLDGQNRLQAIIESGASVEIAVVRDLDPAAQAAIDTAPQRTSGDALTMMGIKNAHQVGAIAKLAVHWQRGEITTCTAGLVNLSHSEIIDCVQADQSVYEAALAGVRYCWDRRAESGIRATPAAVGFAWWLIAGQSSQSAADRFMADLKELRTDGAGDPRSAAVQRLSNANANGEKLRNITQAFVLITAWNGMIEGRKIHRIQIYGRDGAPMKFPELAALPEAVTA